MVEREREIGRETGVRERERQRQRERERDRGEKGVTGEKEKKLQTQKIMQFYLVVLYSAERSEHDSGL